MATPSTIPHYNKHPLYNNTAQQSQGWALSHYQWADQLHTECNTTRTISQQCRL